MSRLPLGFVKKRKPVSPAGRKIKSSLSEFFTKSPVHSQALRTLFSELCALDNPGSNLPTKSTSSLVESRPREKRTSEFAHSSFTSAFITCDGSSEPAEHADPLEAQTPSMSSLTKKAKLSAPRTTKSKQIVRGIGLFCDNSRRGDELKSSPPQQSQVTKLGTRSSAPLPSVGRAELPRRPI